MRRRRRAREGQEKRKRENRRPILKKLCAALLRSFRGQHSEKMKGSARGNWDPREGQQPFRSNPNGVGDCTTTLRRLLIGADRNFARHYPKRSESIGVLGTDRRSVIRVTVTVNSKSELVEDREENQRYAV